MAKIGKITNLMEDGFQIIGTYRTDVPITFMHRNFYVEKDGDFWCPKADTPVPFVTTQNWVNDSALLQVVGDSKIRKDLLDSLKGTNLISHARSELANAVGTANLMLSTQAVNIWEYKSLVSSKPTMDPNTWDWTDAHQAAIAYCKIGRNKSLYYPPGVYLTSKTLDFGGLTVYGSGNNGNTSAEIKALTMNMLLTKLNSGGVLSNIRLNGDNKAAWNIAVLGNRPMMMKVESVYAREYGFVFWSTQNSSFYSLVSYFCLYSYGILNGARNCNFFGCGSATSSGPTGTRDPLQAELVFDYLATSPYDFNLPSGITTNGNDRIAFFGGIFEYPDTIIKMRNTANTPKDVGRVFFYSSEFSSGGKIIDTTGLTSVSSPEMFFDNCEFTWKDQNIAFGIGTLGKLNFRGFCSFSGGAQLVNHGISQVNNLDTKGIRIEDGTMYIDGALNPTTVPKNGFSRPVTTGSITEAISFTAGQKEVFFATPNGLAFTGGTNYRQVKGSMPEALSYAATSGISQVGAYTTTGANPFPAGVTHLVENLGNGATDAALMAFRVRNGGGNNYGYAGVTSNGFVIGIRNNANYQERLNIASPSGNITPGVDNAQNLGSASMRFGLVYAGTSTINTSDGRLKTDIRGASDAEKRVAIKLKGLRKAFRFTDAIENKGSDARIHFGWIAQDVAQAFTDEGLDATAYGMFCHDIWDDEWEDIVEEIPIIIDGIPLLDDYGNPCMEGRSTGEKRLVRPAGDRFGLRLDELLAFIIAEM